MALKALLKSRKIVLEDRSGMFLLLQIHAPTHSLLSQRIATFDIEVGSESLACVV